MAENLEPDPTDPAEAAARATKKMMQGAGLQSATSDISLMDGAEGQAAIAALSVLVIADLSLWIDDGTSVDHIEARIDLVAKILKADRLDKAQDFLRAAKAVLHIGARHLTRPII
jgi:hypothetical protein